MTMPLGTRHAAGRRLFASLAACVFVLALGARGFCAMGGAAEQPHDPHGCCRTGLRPAAPACCVDAPATDTLARQAPHPPVLAAAAPAFLSPADLLAGPSPAAWAFAAAPAHSPPRTASILRI